METSRYKSKHEPVVKYGVGNKGLTKADNPRQAAATVAWRRQLLNATAGSEDRSFFPIVGYREAVAHSRLPLFLVPIICV